MKTFLHRVRVLSVILLQGLLFIWIVMILHPAGTEDYRAIARALSSGKTPFESASRYFYTQAKRNDHELEVDLKAFQSKLDAHDYQQADLIQGKISNRYPEYSCLEEQLRKSQQKFQAEEADRARNAFQEGDYAKALSHIENANETVPAIQYMLGYIHLHFKPKIDYSKARRYLEMALEQKEVKAAYELGDIYETGKDVDINIARAISYYERAFQGNIEDALPKLAELYCRPEISNKGSAIKYNQLFADKGDAAAMFRLAGLTLMQDSYQEKQWPTVEGLYRAAANKGYLPAKETLASLYLNAKISTVDVAEQEKCYLLMAEKGKVEYQVALAELYSGETQPNKQAAFFWLLKAAENGNASARYRVAQCYEKGVGTDADFDCAVYQYRLAAEQGHQEAAAWIQQYDEQQRIAAEKKAAEKKAAEEARRHAEEARLREEARKRAEEARLREEARKRAEEARLREEARKRAMLLARQQWLKQCFSAFQCCIEDLTDKIDTLDAVAFKEKLPELTDMVMTSAYNAKASISEIGNFSYLSDIPLKSLLNRDERKSNVEELEELFNLQRKKKRAEVLSNLVGWKITAKKMGSGTLEKVIKDALREKYPLYEIGDTVNLHGQFREHEFIMKGIFQLKVPGGVKISGKLYYFQDLPDAFLYHFDASLNERLINRKYVNISRRFEKTVIPKEIDHQEFLVKGYIPNIGNFRSDKQAYSANHWETVFELRARIAAKLQKSFEKYIGKTDFSDMIDELQKRAGGYLP